MTLNEYCTGIADAIREKEGSTEKIPAPEHAARILAIDTQEDLSEELTAQDDLIAQIMAAIAKCKITISTVASYGRIGFARVGIGDTEYDATDIAEGKSVVVEVDPGTEIFFYVDGNSATTFEMCRIDIDGENVHSGGGGYGYTVTTDMEILLQVGPYSSTSYYGTIYVTTSGTKPGSDFTPTDSGGTTYKSKFADNNVDLQKILDKVNSL